MTGDLPRKFLRRRVSEDKASRKTRVGCKDESRFDKQRYNWYQSRDPARSVTDKDVGSLEEG